MLDVNYIKKLRAKHLLKKLNVILLINNDQKIKLNIKANIKF